MTPEPEPRAISIEDVRDFLASRGYVPVVEGVGDGCILTLPDGSMHGFATAPGRGVLLNASSCLDELLVPCPDYAARVAVMVGVARACESAAIAAGLAVFCDGEGREVAGLADLVGGPATAGDRARESVLAGVVAGARRDGFSREFEEMAAFHNVVEGYAACKRIATEE